MTTPVKPDMSSSQRPFGHLKGMLLPRMSERPRVSGPRLFHLWITPLGQEFAYRNPTLQRPGEANPAGCPQMGAFASNKRQTAVRDRRHSH